MSKTNGQFKKGNPPWNKGVKMTNETYEKVSKTFFSDGHIPANIKYFGNPYLSCQTNKNGYTEKRWMIVHNKKRMSYLVYLCEQNNIDLKENIPRLKHGFNIENEPTIEDIVVITRAEHIKLNHYQRYPKDIQKLIQLSGVLTRQINKNK